MTGVADLLCHTMQDGECWRWTMCKSLSGYGQVYRPRREPGTRRAHRLMWELVYGAFDPQLVVCHKCDVRDCINPAHLFLGTVRDNVHDCWAKGRHPPLPDGRREGEDHGRAKLAESDVCHIRVATDGPSACGRRHGVTETLVRLIRQGKIWRHL